MGIRHRGVWKWGERRSTARGVSAGMGSMREVSYPGRNQQFLGGGSSEQRRRGGGNKVETGGG